MLKGTIMSSIESKDWPAGGGTLVNVYPALAETMYVEIYVGTREGVPACTISLEDITLWGGPSVHKEVMAAFALYCICNDGYYHVVRAAAMRKACLKIVLKELIRDHRRFWKWLEEERLRSRLDGASEAKAEIRKVLGIE